MAKFKVGDKVKLKSDVTCLSNISKDFLTITYVSDSDIDHNVLYHCDKTGGMFFQEHEFEDTKYITNSEGVVIGSIPMNSIPVIIEKNLDDIKMIFKGDIKMKVKNTNMPEIVNYTYDSETGKTTIKWSDKTETTVVSENPDTADQYTGFVTAIAKRATGNTSHINNLFDKWAIKKPIKDKIAEEKRIAEEIENKRIADKHREKREKWLIRREAIRIKREYEARKLANEKYGVPMDNED